MQTFLPYEGFERSAAVLDQPRLGKQRVETLQLLRALVIPDYGWQNHPATAMWRGYVPALARYGLAMTDEWIARGHSDTVREQILEFAPNSGNGVELPEWLGDEDFHASHRSNLISKDPGFYAGRFPGVTAGLPYVWPEPRDAPAPADPLPADALWIARAVPDPEDPDTARLVLPMLSPKGTPIAGKRGRQLIRLLEDMEEGDPVAVPTGDRSVLRMGTAGPVRLTNDTAAREIRLEHEVPRSAFSYPALLQDPRLLFAVPVPQKCGGR